MNFLFEKKMPFQSYLRRCRRCEKVFRTESKVAKICSKCNNQRKTVVN